jgi:hypothetical protein
LTDVDGLSSRAQRLLAALAAERTVTVRLDRLWELFAQSSPDIAREPAKRSLLVEALTELQDAGHVTTPKGRTSWDRTGAPPLPAFVRRSVRRPKSTAARERLRHPWEPQLSWAGAELRLTAAQQEALFAVNAWLARQRRPPVPLPHRERSLEIFGHEKRLDELLHTPLFAPGRLSLDLLSAYVVHPPFVWQPVDGPTGDQLLVVENHTTFHSVCRAVAHHVSAGTASPFAFIAYGAGNAFEASVTYVADLQPSPARVRYFGDLDAEGVTIPSRASARAVALGLPRVEPHAPLYRMLLDVGSPRPSTSTAAAPTGWLAELQARADALFAAGGRLAQEWVTAEVLRRHADWLVGA